MNEQDMGGPAFAHGNPEQGGDPGMTMWDYHAAAASEEDIQSHIPPHMWQVTEIMKTTGCGNIRAWARGEHADAMLRERSRRENIHRQETLGK